MIEIRTLTPYDADAYKLLRLKSYLESPYSFSESYEDEESKGKAYFEKILNNSEKDFVLGAFSSTHKLIGVTTFRRDPRSKARHKSMIYAMYVLPNYRNQGIAKMLIEEVIRKARSMVGLEQISLWVLQSNNHVSAKNFYKSVGFQLQGSAIKKDLKINGDYVDAYYMTYYL